MPWPSFAAGAEMHACGRVIVELGRTDPHLCTSLDLNARDATVFNSNFPFGTADLAVSTGHCAAAPSVRVHDTTTVCGFDVDQASVARYDIERALRQPIASAITQSDRQQFGTALDWCARGHGANYKTLTHVPDKDAEARKTGPNPKKGARLIKHRRIEVSRRERMNAHFEELKDMIELTAPGLGDSLVSPERPVRLQHKDEILVEAIRVITSCKRLFASKRRLAAEGGT